MANEIVSPIPARLKNVAKGGHVAGASDIVDDALQKEQSVVNADRIADVARLDGEIDAVEQKVDDIGDAIQFDQEGDLVTVDGDDFQDPSARGKIPTVGAILDGRDDGVYDVTAHNDSAKFASLEALLSDENLETLIPTSVRKGGMSIKFVQSSDNKYVQYRLMADTWSTDTDDWALCSEDVLVENPEYINVKTDSEGRILWAIKTDGSIHWGAGVPQQVIDYVTAKIAELRLDEYEDIVAFLSDYLGSDTTLKVLIDSKLDAEGLNTEALEAVQAVENPEYIQVTTDFEDKIIEGITTEGRKEIKIPIDIPSASFDTVKSKEWLQVTIDNDGRLLDGIKKDGSRYSIWSQDVFKEYINNYNNVVTRNRDKENSLFASCRYGTNDSHLSSKDFQICMLADTHSHENEICITNAVVCTNEFPSIDALIHLGDIELWAPRDTYNAPTYAMDGLRKMIKEKMSKCRKPWFIVCGNHEVGGACTFLYYTRTHKEVYDDIVKPIIDAGWLKQGEYNNTSSNYAERCYYYHDFENRKVRLIVLYEYGYPLVLNDNEYWEPVEYNENAGFIEPGVTYTYDSNNPTILNCGCYTEHSFRLKKTVTPTNIPNRNRTDGSWPWYKARTVRIFTKEQMEWLITLLNTTPDGYGIVIASHQPIMRDVDLLDCKFSIGSSPYNKYNPRKDRMATDDFMDKDIIADIINAWQNKTPDFSEKVAVSSEWNERNYQDGTYLNTLVDGDYHYYFEINADFSTRTNNNAYFAGYLSGHEHFDMVERSKAYPTQYNIIPCCSSAAPRTGNDTANISFANSVSYDNLTVFSCGKISERVGDVVNTGNRIGLARIGNTKTIAGIDRDLQIINIINN